MKTGFIDILECDIFLINKLISSAKDIKKNPEKYRNALQNKTLGLFFEKPSTRTRLSFDVGMKTMGGNVVVLNKGDIHFGATENLYDTAKTLSRYLDCAMLRTFDHSTLLDFAKYAEIPVINGLTNQSHPCQIMAALLTFEEHIGSISGAKIAWIGDSNNVLRSYMELATKIDFDLYIATPEGRSPDMKTVMQFSEMGAKIFITTDPKLAASDADVIVTDTWVSMGDKDKDLAPFFPYQINSDLISVADEAVIFSHCLPAHRGFEVSDEVIDAPYSTVFDEAENRMHVQKAILLHLLS